jgi:hypothetical protein
MDNISEEKAKEWSQNWISIIDIEEDGTLDWEAFEEFFNKTIDEEVYDEDDFKRLFISIDTAKTGLLS